MLPLKRIIQVSVNLTPQAAQYNNLHSALFLGSSDVIDVSERIRNYSGLSGVATDFGTSAPEYLAAALYFGQSPQPTSLYIGRWAESATKGLNKGKILTTAQKLLATWTAITDGEFKVSVDGAAATSITGLDFSAQTNLNGVASVIDAALAGATVTWDGDRFRIISATTGTSSSIGYTQTISGGTGTDISAMLLLNSGNGTLIDGIAAESAVEAATLFDDQFGTRWYALMFADTSLTASHHEAVAGYIEAATNAHIYAVSTTDTNSLDAVATSDVGYVLQDGGYTRSFVHYSASDYVAASFLGRALTVNFDGSNTTLTMKFKLMPGVTAEDLTDTQADTLKTKRINVYAAYTNDTAIIQEGVMSGAAWFDEIQNVDWFTNRIQTDIYNLMRSAQKIPQTDAGVNIITSVIKAVLEQARTNGMIYPGNWNAGGFGTLNTGDFMPTGYYVYAQSVNLQSQATRETRVTPPIQIAMKLAGAVHSVDVTVNVNR